MPGGVVRNNVFHRSSGQSGDVGIVVNNSANAKVLHNTVVLSGTYPNAIEYRFAGTTNVTIRNNLSDAGIQQRDGASGTIAGNVTTAQANWFVSAATGDLHLAATATAAIDRAASLADVVNDYDGDARPFGSAPDVGADEMTDGSAPIPPSAPTNVRVVF
jgi:hypothetical protein